MSRADVDYLVFPEEAQHRFTYHPPKPEQVASYDLLRTAAKDLALLILRETPPSREQDLALTRLEEAVMHANSAIARRS